MSLFLEEDRDWEKQRSESAVRRSQERLLYEEEELDQLEKMYKADDLTEETEEIILKNLGKATKGKTTIIISHRTSSVKNADHIIVLDHGKVVQSGVHEDLIIKEGYYQDIYNQQLEEKLSGQES